MDQQLIEQVDQLLAPYFDTLGKRIQGMKTVVNVPEPRVNVTVPDIKIPKIVVPKIELPTINVPTPRVVVPKPEVTVNVDEVTIKNWPEFPTPQVFDDKNIIEALKKLLNKTSGGGGANSTTWFNGSKYIDASTATPLPVTAFFDTSAVQNAGTALTPKFKAFGVASSGTNDLVAAVTGKKIRVLSMMGIVNTQTDLYFLDDTGTPVILFGDSTHKISVAQYGGFVLQYNPLGWMETSVGKKLQVNLSAANKFSGGMVYVEV